MVASTFTKVGIIGLGIVGAGIVAAVIFRATTMAQAAGAHRPTLKSAGIADTLESDALAERARQVNEFRPTHILPSPAVEDEQERAAQLQIAKYLEDSEALLPPAARLTHFAWCDQPGYRLNGFYGQILDVMPIRDGVQVRAIFRPHITSQVAVVSFSGDYLIETYEITGAGLRLAKTEGPPEDQSGVLFGD